jgi:LysM repeat protein
MCSTILVKNGDTLSEIAQANGMSLNELLALNPKYKANPDDVKAGALLILKDNAGTSHWLLYCHWIKSCYCQIAQSRHQSYHCCFCQKRVSHHLYLPSRFVQQSCDDVKAGALLILKDNAGTQSLSVII